jgi:hypothetical protein
LSDATITFPEAYQVAARAVSDGQGGEEIRRQEMLFRVSLWCPSPDVRDELAAFIDLALAGVVFLDVGGWGCRIKSAGGSTDDEGAAARAWRRDLRVRSHFNIYWIKDLIQSSEAAIATPAA